ncbi:MAG: hypothetical protein NC309_12185, partial [Ruminococcus sp.]|nr:hypothetical protein [Ruminococcus sp.]
PASAASEDITYKLNGGAAKNFTDYKDGDDYITVWGLVTQDWIDQFKADGKDSLNYRYAFDWDGNGTADQTLGLKIMVDGIILGDKCGIHDPDQVVEINEVPATCTEDGVEAHKKCKVCGILLDVDGNEIEENDLVISTTGHAAVKTEGKAATCKEAGYEAYWTCSVCEKMFSDEICITEIDKPVEVAIDATAHTATKTEAKDATETEAGNIEYWHCSVCDKYFSDEALTTEITEADTVIPATGAEGDKFATADGYDFYKDEDGNITCVDESGKKVIDEFKCDGEYTYYFQGDGTAMKDYLSYHPNGVDLICIDKDGHMVINDFASDGVYTYYFQGDGTAMKDYLSYHPNGVDLICIDKDGHMVINDFASDGVYTYYFQGDGTAMKDRLTYHPDGVHIIYFDENGHEVFSNFHHVEKSIAGETVDDLCFFDVYGYMYKDVMTYDQAGEKLYYVNPYGVVEQDEWFEFSDTCVWAGTTIKVGAGYGYATADGTLMVNKHIYDWRGNFVYLQGDGHIR